jgi:hypothetical protein
LPTGPAVGDNFPRNIGIGTAPSQHARLPPAWRARRLLPRASHGGRSIAGQGRCDLIAKSCPLTIPLLLINRRHLNAQYALRSGQIIIGLASAGLCTRPCPGPRNSCAFPTSTKVDLALSTVVCTHRIPVRGPWSVPPLAANGTIIVMGRCESHVFGPRHQGVRPGAGIGRARMACGLRTAWSLSLTLAKNSMG